MEEVILNSLFNSERFFSVVFSHLTKDLFLGVENGVIFETIKTYTDEYQKKPGLREIGLSIKESSKLPVVVKNNTISKFKEIVKDGPIDNMDFILDKTEKWIQKQRLTTAIFTAADIIKKDGEFEPIVSMVEESLKISFETSIGLVYNETEEDRMKYYKSKEAFSSTGLASIDKVLGGGIRPSSLFLLNGGSHTGKTAAKIFLTSSLLLKKENVLFVTLEMPEYEIGKRLDANLMGLTINELGTLPDEIIRKKWDSVKNNIGKLVIKEYGAGTFNTLQLKALIDELKTKKDFIPDAVVVDYLGLMTSHRASANSNSYDSLGKVAEDLHALSKHVYDSRGKKGIKVITSSQLNRSSYGNLSSGMEAVSESLKIMMTADVAIMLLTNDQLRGLNQQVWKFVKNRYTGDMRSVLIETNFARMMYKDLEEGDEPVKEIMQNQTPISTGLDFGSFVF